MHSVTLLGIVVMSIKKIKAFPNLRSSSHADYTEYDRKKNQIYQIYDIFFHMRKKLNYMQVLTGGDFHRLSGFVALEAANGSHQAGRHWKPFVCTWHSVWGKVFSAWENLFSEGSSEDIMYMCKCHWITILRDLTARLSYNSVPNVTGKVFKIVVR